MITMHLSTSTFTEAPYRDQEDTTALVPLPLGFTQDHDIVILSKSSDLKAISIIHRLNIDMPRE